MLAQIASVRLYCSRVAVRGRSLTAPSEPHVRLSPHTETLQLLNSFLIFFIVKQQKPKALIFQERCCSGYVVLTILNYISFKCFKSILRPCHAWAFGF